MIKATVPHTPSLAEKVRFLSRPQSYPELPATVAVIETHFSYVFLTPSQVFKLKKPQRLPFLDLSALEARHRNCVEEVRLNRVLAPDVYRGVVTLRTDARGNLTLTGQGQAVDHLVHMRRLDDGINLETRLKSDCVNEAEVNLAAERLAHFYRRAALSPPGGTAVRRSWCTTLAEELVEYLGAWNGGDRLRELLLRWLDAHPSVLDRRSRVDAHGDLRPQHVYLGPDPVFIDRLEFDARLRALDPVEELCFFTLECERLGARWVGERFLERYAALTGDDRSPQLEAFYEAGRALLWAVLSARHLTTPSDEDERWRQRAGDYVQRGIRRLSHAP